MQQRESLLDTTRLLAKLGLNRGTSGNVSVREGPHFLVTPSGMDVEAMTPHDMVLMEFDGTVRPHAMRHYATGLDATDHHATSSYTTGSHAITHAGKPSSEWRFHRDILQARPEVNAVIHTHSTFATTLSCLRRDVPPFHYMIAVAGGDSIRCAPYALFGSQALSDSALTALAGRRACLLANHGMIAVGASLKQALDVTVEVEALCEQYLRALQIGEPCLLTASEMADVFQQFQGYSKWGASS